jgi:hypothetical protein
MNPGTNPFIQALVFALACAGCWLGSNLVPRWFDGLTSRWEREGVVRWAANRKIWKEDSPRKFLAVIQWYHFNSQFWRLTLRAVAILMGLLAGLYAGLAVFGIFIR